MSTDKTCGCTIHLDVDWTTLQSVERMRDEIKSLREWMPFLTFGDPSDRVVVMDCLTELGPLLDKAVESYSCVSDLPDDELQEALRLTKLLKTTFLCAMATEKDRTSPTKEEEPRPTGEEDKTPPPPPTKEEELPPIEQVPLHFNIDFVKSEDIQRLHQETKSLQSMLSEISLGDLKRDRQLRNVVNHMVPLLDEMVDPERKDTERTKLVRLIEIRRDAHLLERIFLGPLLR